MTSIKVGCSTRSQYASSGPKADGAPTNNQSGRGSGPCRLWGGLNKTNRIVPTTLLVREQRFGNYLYKTVKGPSTRPIVLSMIAGSYWRCRRRFTIFESDEMKFASPFDPPKFVDKITAIPCDTKSWNDIAPNSDRSSEYDLKNFPNVFWSLWYL